MRLLLAKLEDTIFNRINLELSELQSVHCFLNSLLVLNKLEREVFSDNPLMLLQPVFERLGDFIKFLLICLTCHQLGVNFANRFLLFILLCFQQVDLVEMLSKLPFARNT